MASTFLTPSVIGRETLSILKSELGIANMVYRDYESDFTSAKVGDTIAIRAPASYEVQEFTGTTTEQSSQEGRVELKLTKHLDLTIPVTSKELTLELDSFAQQILVPAAVAWAEKIDKMVYEVYKDVYNAVGTAGSPPDTLAKVTDIDRVLNELRVPARNRNAFVDPLTKAKLLQIEAFHRADARGDGGTALEQAKMGNLLNLNWFMGQNIKRHTAGSQGSGAGMTLSAAAPKGATSISITGAGSTNTFLKGDLVSIAGVTLDNETTTLAMFVVTQDATASGGNVTLNIYPALPMNAASSSAVTGTASHRANLVFVKEAIALAIVPLDKPMGTDKASIVQGDGFAMRVVQSYNTTTKKDTISMDCLAGVKVIDQRLIARILG